MKGIVENKINRFRHSVNWRPRAGLDFGKSRIFPNHGSDKRFWSPSQRISTKKRHTGFFFQNTTYWIELSRFKAQKTLNSIAL